MLFLLLLFLVPCLGDVWDLDNFKSDDSLLDYYVDETELKAILELVEENQAEAEKLSKHAISEKKSKHIALGTALKLVEHIEKEVVGKRSCECHMVHGFRRVNGFDKEEKIGIPLFLSNNGVQLERNAAASGKSQDCVIKSISTYEECSSHTHCMCQEGAKAAPYLPKQSADGTDDSSPDESESESESSSESSSESEDSSESESESESESSESESESDHDTEDTNPPPSPPPSPTPFFPSPSPTAPSPTPTSTQTPPPGTPSPTPSPSPSPSNPPIIPVIVPASTLTNGEVAAIVIASVVAGAALAGIFVAAATGIFVGGQVFTGTGPAMARDNPDA